MTLYAVLEKRMVTVDNAVISGVYGTAMLTADRAVEWTVDLGTTEAVVSQTDTALTIAAAGFAGEVKVTAMSKADPQTAQEVTVRLIGATEWKPGVDVVTGTTKPLGFEGMTEEEVWYGYANNWANAFALMNDPADDNNKVMGLCSDAYKVGHPSLDL